MPAALIILFTFLLFHTDRHTGLEAELQIVIVYSDFFVSVSICYQRNRLTSKVNVIKLTIIGKNTGVCTRDSGILLFNLGLERHDKQTDQNICLKRY